VMRKSPEVASTTGVYAGSAFGPPTAIRCRRRCLAGAVPRQWPPAPRRRAPGPASVNP